MWANFKYPITTYYKKGEDWTLIHFISPYELRILVGITITALHNSLKILLLYKVKLAEYEAKLVISFLSPSQIMNGYKAYWWLSLKYIDPILLLLLKSNILGQFYWKMLPRIKVNRNYLTAMIMVLVSIGSLGLLSIEVQ